MSTRSYIGTLKDGNTVEYIYCHFDGYLKGVGRTLVKNYDTPFKVEQLFALGDISELRETPETTVAYHRDRGERFLKRGLHTKKNIITNAGVDYVYLYNLDMFEWEAYCTTNGVKYSAGENITEHLQIAASLEFI